MLRAFICSCTWPIGSWWSDIDVSRLAVHCAHRLFFVWFKNVHTLHIHEPLPHFESVIFDEPQAVKLDCDKLKLDDSTISLDETCCDGLRLFKEIHSIYSTNYLSTVFITKKKRSKNQMKLTEIYLRSIMVCQPCTLCILAMMENFHMYSIRMTIFRFHRHFRFLHLMTHSCCVLCSVNCLLIICVYMCASLCVYGYRWSPEIHNFHTNIKN